MPTLETKVEHLEFQSTRPRGARRASGGDPGLQQHFNPRAHEGRDACASWRHAYEGDFNPRAHEGRDEISEDIAIVFFNFNPRAHEGRDRKTLQ